MKNINKIPKGTKNNKDIIDLKMSEFTNGNGIDKLYVFKDKT